MILADASTAHKLQGVTIMKGQDYVVHGHKKMPKGMAYVMLSRCSDMNNLYLADNFDVNMIKCIPNALKEKEKFDTSSIRIGLQSPHNHLP